MVGRQAALLSVIHHRHSGKPLLAKAYMKSNIAFDERLAEALAKQTVPNLTVSDADRKWSRPTAWCNSGSMVQAHCSPDCAAAAIAGVPALASSLKPAMVSRLM